MSVARDLALRAHGRQQYGEQPYAAHLTAVVTILRDFGFHGPYEDAGWLHDAIEDTDLHPLEIAHQCGLPVLQMVQACTGKGDTRAKRNRAIAAKIKALPEAAVVKLADRIANVEAARPGDRHAMRYAAEQHAFEQAVRQFVPEPMWMRLVRALEGVAGSSDDTREGASRPTQNPKTPNRREKE